MILKTIGYAPLLPLAFAFTLGIAIDRHWAIPTTTGLMVVGSGLLFWLFAIRKQELIAALGVCVACFGLGMAHHHRWRYDFPGDDIGIDATVQPKLVSVRGFLDEEPVIHARGKDEPMLARPRTITSTAVVQVTEIDPGTGWAPRSGRVKLYVEGDIEQLHTGDELEIMGWLAKPDGPMNPGEFDYSSKLLDERIRATLRVKKTTEVVVRLNEGSWGIKRALARVRGWAMRGLKARMPQEQRSIAAALLLGDNAAMSTDEWDRYIRTGVIHVLAISGQHLAVLGAFLWVALRLMGLRRRPAALIVAGVLLGYALLTGGRPSAMRAAVMACALCGGIWLQRPALAGNIFSLAWLVILALNPNDFFNAGFQLSFLCVAVLIWGIPRWFPERELSEADQFIDAYQPFWYRASKYLLKIIWKLYLVTIALSLSTAPLVMYWQHLVSPAGILIGPLAIILSSVALLAGFLLLMTWPIPVVAPGFAWVATVSIQWCEWVVKLADRQSWAVWYVGRVPLWWVIGFYALGFAWLFTGRWNWPKLPRYSGPGAIAAWVLIGLLGSVAPRGGAETRITFVAVEHGGCALIETTDGRVILYDTGAAMGPEVTRHHIAPMLWSRGIRKIDEIFLSHADLDHFNGLIPLMNRFAIGQITWTSSFADKPTQAVKLALEAIEARGIPTRVVKIDDRFQVGDTAFEVLHPPLEPMAGTENVRSLVLRVQHADHTILLTGDIEGPGLDRLLDRELPLIDVLMTPHHGSDQPRLQQLSERTKPLLVVSCQGRADAGRAQGRYRAPYWATATQGAITIRSRPGSLTADSFKTGEVLELKRD